MQLRVFIRILRHTQLFNIPTCINTLLLTADLFVLYIRLVLLFLNSGLLLVLAHVHLSPVKSQVTITAYLIIPTINTAIVISVIVLSGAVPLETLLMAF